MGYIGVNNVAKQIKAIYCGIDDGKARNVMKAYVGVNGKAKLWWDLNTSPIIPTPGRHPTLRKDWTRGHHFDSENITIIISNYYVPQTSVDDQWMADEEGLGAIMCYRVGETIYISGNRSGKIFTPVDSSHLFCNDWLYEITGVDLTIVDIQGLRVLDTSNTTNMYGMFAGCLTDSIDVSGFDTSNVENMREMFRGCDYITSLNLLGFDTSKCKSIYNMFINCDNLMQLDLTSFDTGAIAQDGDQVGVDPPGQLFAYCPKLQVVYVDEEKWTITDQQLTQFDAFYLCGCSSVTRV